MLFVEQNCIHLATPGAEYNKKMQDFHFGSHSNAYSEVKCEPIFQLCEDITEEQ